MPLLLSFTWWWQSADVIEYCLVLIPREKWTSSSQAPFPNRRGKESPQLWCFCKPGTCQNSQVIFHKINWREIVFQSPNIILIMWGHFDNLLKNIIIPVHGGSACWIPRIYCHPCFLVILDIDGIIMVKNFLGLRSSLPKNVDIGKALLRLAMTWATSLLDTRTSLQHPPSKFYELSYI